MLETDVQLQQAAQIFAHKLDSMYPAEVGTVVNLVLPNLPNGCYWGFVREDNIEFRQLIDDIRKSPSLSVTPIRGGFMVEIALQYLLDILAKTAGNVFGPQDIMYAQQNRQKHMVSLSKFMERGQSGKIGIFNLNDVPRITVNGKTYPAYNVTITDLIGLCAKNGYNFVMNKKERTPAEVMKHLPEVMARLELAPSKNALFIEIKKASPRGV